MSDAAPPAGHRREPAPASPPRWAQIGITVQFLALVRILAEYFRLSTSRAAGSPSSSSTIT